MPTELIEGLYNKRVLVVPEVQNPAKTVPVHEVNLARPPFVLPSLVLAVPTSLSLLFSATIQSNVELHAILIIPTPNAQANNVQFYINYGNYTIGTPSNLAGIIIPITIGFDRGDYPILQQGQNVSLYASASATGSGLQVIFVGVFI